MPGRVALLVASLLVSFLLAEAGLRVAGFDFPQFHERDDLLGLTLRPGAEGWQTEEGRAYVKVNSAGMRDVERPRPRAPGLLRIAVLGDSYTEAIQVERDAAFPALLEDHLARCGLPAEVLNFGVSGFGTAQQLLALRARVAAYRPDIVLLAFFPSNDVRNNSRALESDRLRPFYVRNGARLELDASFRDARAYRVLSNTAYRFLREHSRVLGLALKARKGLAGLELENAEAAQPGLDWLVFAPPATREWREAWDLTERLLAEMRAVAAAQGAGFVLASVADPVAIHPDVALRKRYAAQLQIPDFLYPERRLGAFAARHGIDYLPLTPGMERLSHGKALHGFGENLGSGHWNEAGHGAAAQLLGEFLCGPGDSMATSPGRAVRYLRKAATPLTVVPTGPPWLRE